MQNSHKTRLTDEFRAQFSRDAGANSTYCFPLRSTESSPTPIALDPRQVTKPPAFFRVPVTLVRRDNNSVRHHDAVFVGDVHVELLAGLAAPREGSVGPHFGTSGPLRVGGFAREPEIRHNRVALLEAPSGAVDHDAGLAAHRRAFTSDGD